MIKLSIMVMVAVMFYDQYHEVIGNRFWFLIGWVAIAAAADFFSWKTFK